MSIAVEAIRVRALRVQPQQHVAITVVMQDIAPGQGALIVESWGRAWSAAWSGMRCGSVLDLVLRSDPAEIAERLLVGACAGLKRGEETELRSRVLRIAQAVQLALLEQHEAAQQPGPSGQ